MYKEISPKQYLDLKSKEKVILIDVREPYENEDVKIEEAKLIPLSEVSLDSIGDFDGKIIIHCRSGGRSARACTKLLSENDNLDIYNLEGGIMEWENQGLPVLRSPKKKFQ